MNGVGLVLRRARSNATIVLVAAVTVLLSTAIVTAAALYSAAVGSAGVRQALEEAPVRSLGVQVSVRAAEDDADRIDAAVRDRIATTLGDVAGTVSRSEASGSMGLAAPAAPPGSLTTIAAYDDLDEHVLLTGAQPGVDVGAGAATAVEAVVSDGAAMAMGVNVGDTVEVVGGDGAPTAIEIVGSYRVLDTGDPFWFADELETTGVRQRDYITLGPIVVAPETFERSFAAAATTRWRVTVDPGVVAAADLAALSNRARALEADLQRTADATVATDLPDLLDGLRTPLVVARSTILIPVLQLCLLAMSGVLLAARLLTEHRIPENALVRARGASRGQVLRWSLGEAAIIVAPAAVLGAVLGAALLGLLNDTGPVARARVELPNAPGSVGWTAAAVAAAVAMLPFVLPALTRAGTYVEARSRIGRQLLSPAVQRNGLDLALLALAVVAYLQLRRYAAPVTLALDGALGIDPVLVAAPAVMLLAGGVLTLRVLPRLAGPAERVVGRMRSATAALAVWQTVRRPSRVGAPVLLLVLALAIGVVSGAYASTLARSQRDQARFSTGADARARSLPGAGAGVSASMPVDRARAQVGADTGTALLLDADLAVEVVALRPDLVDGDVAVAWADLASRRPDPAAVAIPSGSTGVVLALSARPLGRVGEQATAAVVLVDDNGQIYRLNAGPLTLDGAVHELAVELPAAGLDHGLRLLAVELGVNVLSQRQGTPVEVRLHAIRNQDRVEFGTGLDWRPAIAGQRAGPGGEGTVRVLVALDDLRPIDTSIPAIVHADWLPPSGDHRALDVSIDGTALSVTPVANTSAVPTAAGERGIMLDLGTVAYQRWLVNGITAPTDEWWLRLDGDPSVVAAGVPAGELVVAAAVGRDLRDDPLSVGVVGALVIAFGAASAFAVLGFAVSLSVAGRERRAELAVLRALGLSRRQLSRMLLVEQGVAVAFGLIVGLGLGLLVARLVVPLVLLTPQAQRPLPAALLEIPWLRLAALTGVVLVALVVVVRLVSARLARAGLGQALRLGEDP
jgi:hypothetical protein